MAGLLAAEQRPLGHNQTKGQVPSVCFPHPSVHTQACATQQTQANVQTHRSHAQQHTHSNSVCKAQHLSTTQLGQIQPPAHFLFCCFFSLARACMQACMHPCTRTHTHKHAHLSPPQGLHIRISRWTQLAHLASTSYSFLCPEPDTPCVLVRRPWTHQAKREHEMRREGAKRGRVGKTQRSVLFIPWPGPAHSRGWGRVRDSPPVGPSTSPAGNPAFCPG